jgi:hypothetical protein
MTLGTPLAGQRMFPRFSGGALDADRQGDSIAMKRHPAIWDAGEPRITGLQHAVGCIDVTACSVDKHDIGIESVGARFA